MSGNPYYGLMNAIRQGDLDRIKTFIDTFRLSNSLARLKGYNLLREAIQTNQTAIARLLLISGSKVNSKSKKPTYTPLHYAVISNNVELVNMLLDRCANVNAKNPDGKTPLCFAVNEGNAKITRSLLESGANVNNQSKYGITPLHLAVESGHVQIAELLLNRGAHVNPACSSPNHEGYTPLHYASKRGSEELVKLLLDNGADINAITGDKSTALHEAAISCQEKIVKVLLEYGGCDINAQNKDGKTVLLHVSAQGNEELVKLLLNNGADINASTEDKSTALHAAVEKSQEKIVKVLLEYGGFDINARNKDGNTALYYASKKGHEELVKLLLDNGADINASTEDRSTVLHVAVREEQEKIVKLMLEYGGCDINARDKDGETALHNVCARGYANIVKELLKCDECQINARDDVNRTALDWAYFYNYPIIITLLLDNGANVYTPKMKYFPGYRHYSDKLRIDYTRKGFQTVKVMLEHGECDVNARDKLGNSILHYFNLEGCENFVQFLSADNAVPNAARTSWHNIVKVLLRHGGFGPNARHKNGKSLLQIAVEQRYLPIVSCILELCPEINIENNRGCLREALNGYRYSKQLVEILLEYGLTIHPEDANDCYVLHGAIRIGNLKIIKDLLRYGADVNMTQHDDRGYTLLHTALIHRQIKAAKLLINHGADVNAKAKNGNVPIFYAVDSSDVNMTKLLLSSGANMKDRYDLLHTAVKTGSKEIVEIIVNNLDCDINAGDYFGRTALHIAANLGNEKIVELLLDKGADIKAIAEDKSTVLHAAAQDHRRNVVKILLKYGGCDVNARNKNGKTVLEVAMSHSDTPIIEHILALCPEINFETHRSSFRKVLCHPMLCKAYIELFRDYGFTVHSEDAKNRGLLHAAVQEGCLKIIEDLLRCSADVNGRGYGSDNYTTLHNAALHKQIEAAKILINYGADVNAKTVEGMLPISYAIKNVDVEMIKLLLSNGASTKDCPHMLRTAVKGNSTEMVEFLLHNLYLEINASDDDGRTALHSAVVLRQSRSLCFRENEDDLVSVDIRQGMAEMLLSLGADVNARTKDGLTPLHVAIEREKNGSVVGILLEHNADVNCAAKCERTPLHYSAKKGNQIVTKMLLNKGANVNAKDENGNTPLHVACVYRYKEVVATLLEYGAEIDAENKEGVSPLQIAAAYGSLKIVENLLKLSARIECRDKRDRTALHMASIYGRKYVVEKLLAYGSDINVTCQIGHTPLDYAIEFAVNPMNNMFVSMLAEKDFGIHFPCDYRDEKFEHDHWRYEHGPGNNQDICHDHFEAHHPYRITDIFERHIVKMKAINLYVSQQNLKSVNFEENHYDFNNDCKREVKMMQKGKISDTSISYYDLLTKGINQLAKYARNEGIVEVLESAYYVEQFPIYGDMICRNFKRAKERERLLNPSLKSLNFLFKFMLPDIAPELLCYLSNKDLENLIKATTNTDSNETAG